MFARIRVTMHNRSGRALTHEETRALFDDSMAPAGLIPSGFGLMEGTRSTQYMIHNPDDDAATKLFFHFTKTHLNGHTAYVVGEHWGGKADTLFVVPHEGWSPPARQPLRAGDVSADSR